MMMMMMMMMIIDEKVGVFWEVRKLVLEILEPRFGNTLLGMVRVRVTRL